MNENRTIEKRREAWLTLAKEIALAAYERKNYLIDACPLPHESENARTENLRKVAEANRQISARCKDQRAVEDESEPLGVKALLGREPSEAIRITLILGVLKNITNSLGFELNTPAEYVDWAAGREPGACIAARQAFSCGGELRPHFHVEPSETVGRHQVEMTEEAFLKTLSLPPDRETEVLAALKSPGKKR